MVKYYKSSGNFSPVSFLYLILTVLIIFPILALIYTYLIWYIPFIYINLFITIGFGFAVGIALNALVIKLGKVRNVGLAVLLALIGGLAALYLSWAIWVDLVINVGESYGNSRIGITTSNIQFFQVVDLVLQPGILFDLIVEINDVGTWGIRSATVSGTFLTIIWVIEALIVMVIPILSAIGQADSPFCEFDNKWFVEKELPAFNFIKNHTELIKNLENSVPTSFDSLEFLPNTKTESHSIFSLYTSKKGESYLSIENKKMKTNRKGEIEFDDNEFITYISLNSELRDVLLQRKNTRSID